MNLQRYATSSHPFVSVDEDGSIWRFKDAPSLCTQLGEWSPGMSAGVQFAGCVDIREAFDWTKTLNFFGKKKAS